VSNHILLEQTIGTYLGAQASKNLEKLEYNEAKMRYQETCHLSAAFKHDTRL
jgi:hypothetical protein